MSAAKHYSYYGDGFTLLFDGVSELTRLIHLYSCDPSPLELEVQIEELMGRIATGAKKIGGTLGKRSGEVELLTRGFLTSPSDQHVYIKLMQGLEKFRNELRDL